MTHALVKQLHILRPWEVNLLMDGLEYEIYRL